MDINPDTGGPDTPLDILGRATACDATKPPESAVCTFFLFYDLVFGGLAKAPPRGENTGEAEDGGLIVATAIGNAVAAPSLTHRHRLIDWALTK